jgi:chorismate lyase / 3-hydroxybenzoate synthase
MSAKSKAAAIFGEGTIMRKSAGTLDQAATAAPRLAVRYADVSNAPALLAEPGAILGVVGYGAARPAFLPEPCPFMSAPLAPAAGGAMLEIWRVAAPCRPLRFGAVTGACNEDFAFVSVTIDEAGSACLEDAVEGAYSSLFDCLDAAGFAAPLRFWNYLSAITHDEHGLERYRRFNIGRHAAFSARLRDPLPPPASAIGGHLGTSVIYALAGHQPARMVENPRQVSAYAYPPVYGPRSPSFSRASIHGLGTAETMFISGTASITGHETRHVGDLHSQIAETIENLRVLNQEAARPTAPGEDWACKIYLRDEADHEPVRRAVHAAFGPTCHCLYLHGDICRAELVVEIEVFQHITG